MRILTLHILYSLINSFAMTLISVKNENFNENLITCLENVVEFTDWKNGEIFVVVEDGGKTNDNIIQLFNLFSRVILRANNDYNFPGLVNGFFLTHDFRDLRKTLETFDFSIADKRGKFVITVAENFEEFSEIKRLSEGIPEFLWKKHQFNVILLINCSGKILIMSYNPFEKNCEPGELKIVDVWSDSKFQKRSNLFPDKIVDLNNCAFNFSVHFSKYLKVEAFEKILENGEKTAGGVGGELVSIVAEKMNFKLKLMEPKPRDRADTVKKVIQGESLLTVAGYLIDPEIHKNLDNMPGYMENSIILSYMNSDSGYSWKNLLSPFSSETWLAVITNFTIYFLLILLFQKAQRSGIIPEKIRFLDSFAVFWGNSRVLPETGFVKCVVVSWAIYSYVVTSAYTSGLVSYLTAPKLQRVIETNEDLLADGIRFGGTEELHTFYEDPDDPIMKRIYGGFEICEFDQCMEEFYKGDLVTGVLESYSSFYNSEQNGDIQKEIHMLKNRVFTYQSPIYMKKGSPFVPGIHKYVSRAVQSGLTNYWLERITWKSRIGGSQARNGKKSSKPPSPLSMKHLQGIFFLLFVGLVCSFVIFLGERIFHKHSLKVLWNTFKST